MSSVRTAATTIAPLCVVALSLSACATSGVDASHTLTTPDALAHFDALGAESASAPLTYEAMAKPTMAVPVGASTSSPTALAATGQESSGLAAAISSTIASAAPVATTRPVSHGIVFGAPFDCKPSHAGAGGAR